MAGLLHGRKKRTRPDRRRDKRALTPMQRAFVAALVEDPRITLTEAARRAGSRSPGTRGCQWAALPRVQKALEEARAALEERSLVSGTSILVGLGRLWTEGTYPDGTLADRTKERLTAAELLGKNHRLFVDRVEHSGKLTLEDLIREAAQPAPEE